MTDTAHFPTEKNGNSHPTPAGTMTGTDSSAPEKGKQPPPCLDEVPPKQLFTEVATNLDNTRMTEKPQTTSFHIVKSILNSTHKSDSISDDETVVLGKNPYKLGRIRMSMMIAIP